MQCGRAVPRSATSTHTTDRSTGSPTMSTALTQLSQDARHLPRVLCSILVGLMVSACAAPVNQLASPSTAFSPTLSASPTLTTYVDAATGIAFQAPVWLYVTPAVAGAAGTTTQAIFSTY